MSDRHLVVVEAYEGLVEFLTDAPHQRSATWAIGLPLDALADRIDGRFTVLGWEHWSAYEATGSSFLGWMPVPATRPLAPPPAPPGVAATGRVHRRSIPARDPVTGQPFATSGPSPQSHGMLANSDPLFLMSYCLQHELAALHREDPFAVVIVPMWGGLGYVPQLTRATGAPGALDVPFVVVVTDTSACRHTANQEGAWTRPGITRRQMEDLSLGLADTVLTFGPRGDAMANAGRLATGRRIVRAPRAVDADVIARVGAAASQSVPDAPIQFVFGGPQQASAGALAALDGVRALVAAGDRLERPFVSGGPDMVFAPMKPRTFVDYWSSRGFVKDLVAAGQWRWTRGDDVDDGVDPVHVYPAPFAHLPVVWDDLARGHLVLLSAAATEGLAGSLTLPPEAVIPGEPDGPAVAEALDRSARLRRAERDAVRRALGEAVVTAHGGGERERLLEETSAALAALLSRATPPRLGRVARLLLDRRRGLNELDVARDDRTTPPCGDGTLSVVVPCHEAGRLLIETVESVWASERVPDELLLVDDGSFGDETLATIRGLEAAAQYRRRPLTIVRQENRGLAAARNAGLARARGEFVSFLDADDLIDPRFYRMALALLAHDPDLGGVAAWALCFGDGVPDGFWNAPQPELPLLLVENTVFVPTMTRTATLRALGGYDEAQRYNYEDWELSIRMLASGLPIVTIPAYLQRYRVRPDSLLRTMCDTQNQAMREQLLARHRAVADRFGVEVAMQIEHRLMRFLHAPKPAAPAASVAPPLARVSARARRSMGAVRALAALTRHVAPWMRGSARERVAA